ncbi:MAG: hypothetical protein KC592_19865 [Nitrospira sp.]|nr:hypothetical protein [Nitrospira sp.]
MSGNGEADDAHLYLVVDVGSVGNSPAAWGSHHESTVMAHRPVGTQTRHQEQTTLKLTSAHAKTGQIQRTLRGLRTFFADCRATAEQLGWAALMAQDALSHFCGVPVRNASSSPTVIPSSDIIPKVNGNFLLPSIFQLPFLG